MNWKKFFGFVFSSIFVLFTITLLILYWFVPFKTTEFWIKTSPNANFSLNSSELVNMQFYENMRFPNPEISYKIKECPLQKQEDMKRSLDIIENLSLLEFYPINSNEEISITCDSKAKIEGGLFIAGEGGPVNITKTENFNVITHGKILLIKDSKCPNPNVGIHELLHVLGFDHSKNSNNIMYNVSKCRQTIGDDIPQLINDLYSYPSYSDLAFENVSAVMNGRFLDLNMTVRNHGLRDSEESKIIIYADDKPVKEFDLDKIEIGVGRMIILTHVWVPKINFDELRFYINTSFNELDKENNEIILKIKK